MSVDIYNQIGDSASNDQSFFDAYNQVMFSGESNSFFKLMMRHDLFNLTKDLLGDIVECGVFKGSGMAAWLKMIKMYYPHDLKKVIGFDFFEPSFVEELKDDVDKKLMSQVFSRCANLAENELSKDGVESKLKKAGFTDKNFELVQGDISITSKEYLEKRPGFRISILYMDLDIDEPTYATLTNLWDRVVSGGIVVFDEYAYHSWSESNAVDRFFKDKDVKLIKTGIASPTAYVIKK